MWSYVTVAVGGRYRLKGHRGQGRRRSAPPPSVRGGADLACYASLDAYSDPSLVRAGVPLALEVPGDLAN
jgi:hypothetical protein